jgi:Transglutaminase-like superfamily
MNSKAVMELSKLRGLSRREKKLIFSAWVLLWSLRVGLWFNPAMTLHRVQRRSVNRYNLVHAPVYQILWAIQFTSQYVARPTCLTQGLAAKSLLAKFGYESKLHMGVAQDDQKLEAHAWLTQHGQVILGDVEDLSRYRPLSTAKGHENTLVWRSS